ncbi:hypothetical protein, partial [Thiolapillus sp.]|uniref:hypothetical protein n=1 Tax=Thiolapillus sp. TaxID=2017437 RepID=UPI0025DFA908
GSTCRQWFTGRVCGAKRTRTPAGYQWSGAGEGRQAHSGSLEEFTQEKEAVEVPDISNLSLDR